jgi:hypothetical protein
MDWEKQMFEPGSSPVRAAIMVAMTPDQKLEKELIAEYKTRGILCAATMISGRDFEARPRILRNMIGLCLNEGIIEKKTEHIHPLVHAIHEACQTARLVDSYAAQNFCVKGSAARCGHWIVVCFYGEMGMHEFSVHGTIGIGSQVLV